MRHQTLLGRMPRSLLNQRLGFFAAGLVLVISGVLVALAVDGWISDLHDRQTESAYLELLAKDIEETRNQANLQIEFEKEKIDTAAGAYAALTASDPRTKRTEIYSSQSVQ